MEIESTDATLAVREGWFGFFIGSSVDRTVHAGGVNAGDTTHRQQVWVFSRAAQGEQSAIERFELALYSDGKMTDQPCI